MKAWQFTEVGKIPELADVAEPTPDADEVVVDVKAAGLCHTDIAIIEGPGVPWLARMPVVLGHEVAGVVSAVGADVTDLQIGDRIGLGGDSLQTTPGIAWDGGYATKARGKAHLTVRIPDGVSYEQAAAGTDAGATSYHAVMVTGGAHEHSMVGIIGLGGLGLTGARIAVLTGAQVFGVDTNEAVHQTALDLGVEKCFTDVADLSSLGLDIIVDFAGFGTTTAAAIDAVAPGGRVVLVGLGVLESLISTNALITKQVQLLGSFGASRDSVQGVFDLLGSGDLVLETTAIPFEEIGDGLRRLQQGGVRGRLVAHVDD